MEVTERAERCGLCWAGSLHSQRCRSGPGSPFFTSCPRVGSAEGCPEAGRGGLEENTRPVGSGSPCAGPAVAVGRPRSAQGRCCPLSFFPRSGCFVLQKHAG